LAYAQLKHEEKKDVFEVEKLPFLRRFVASAIEITKYSEL
jgi:hypothetical protein